MLEHLTIHIYHSLLDGPSGFSSSSGSSTGEGLSVTGLNGANANKLLSSLPLFAGQTPLLSTCSFTSFNFNWDPNLTKGLRVLRLGGYFNGHAPTLSALLAILRECPGLEELSLRNLSEGEGDGHNGGSLNGSGQPVGNCVAQPATVRGCVGSGGSSASQSALAAEHSSMAGNKTIVLPRLTSLTLYYASPAHSLLPLLSLPSLTHLTLAFLQNVSSVLQCLYNQALTKLPLKTLRIESCIFNEITFVNLLKRLNGLLSLELVDVEDLSGGALRVCPFISTIPLTTLLLHPLDMA